MSVNYDRLRRTGAASIAPASQSDPSAFSFAQRASFNRTERGLVRSSGGRFGPMVPTGLPIGRRTGAGAGLAEESMILFFMI